MFQLTMARPYAKAAFELAQSDDALPQWSEMLALGAAIASDPVIIDAMKDPEYKKKDLVDWFADVGKELFTAEMKQFVEILANFNRLSILPEIQALYEELRAQAEKRVNVGLTSAKPLEMPFKEKFIEALKKRLRCDVVLACETDPKILGGAIVRANDLVIDGSIRGRLVKLGDEIGIS